MSTNARDRVIAAALEEVREHGWATTSMQRVRERAGVSNGSLFHHFPTRTELEAAVLGQTLADHHSTMLSILARSRSARSGIRSIVRVRFDWVAGNPSLATMLLSSLPGELAEHIDNESRGEREELFDGVADWLRSHGWSDQPGLFMMVAMWLGPSNELARNTMSLGADPPSSPVIDVLAEAAWHSLRPHLREEET